MAGKFQTGAYLVDDCAGSGKTHTVRRILEEREANYVILNGRITPAALYDEIEERPDSVIVIDDVPTLFDSQHAAQILLAAIGGDPGTARQVTYVTKAARRITEFKGGVIAISNRPLRRDPASLALASRMASLEHEPTDEMLVAFMRDAARRGVSGVPARECVTVCEHIVDVCRSGDYRIDLRHFFKGIEDYRCWKSGVCETDWRVLVESAMHRVGADELPPAPASGPKRRRLSTRSFGNFTGGDSPWTG